MTRREFWQFGARELLLRQVQQVYGLQHVERTRNDLTSFEGGGFALPRSGRQEEIHGLDMCWQISVGTMILLLKRSFNKEPYRKLKVARMIVIHNGLP